MILHAGLIGLYGRSGWSGVLIEGPSGAGKSDLALRCLQSGFRLVADDRVVVWASGDAVYGRAPAPLSGLVEARGLGVVGEAPLDLCAIRLRLRLAASPQAVERLPDPVTEPLLGHPIPCLDLWPFELSAPAKISRALQPLGIEP